ncbi:hypothetical protein F5Y10DRAFT_214844 [Nemania abortiva]|nr:hypothetical protein F5Y10DRAFT_214844 [Nemania abortiva]
MENHPRPRDQIRRVPVPNRHPDPASATATAPARNIYTGEPSLPAIIHSMPSDQPSIESNFNARSRYRPRGPIPIVATNSQQPLPSFLSDGDKHNHCSQTPQLPFQYTIQMDPESQNQQSTLPPQLEDDIKAAVLASMPSPGRSVPIKRRKTVVHRKNLRWASLSICIILIVGEIPVSVIFGLDISALFAFILAALLAFWDGWRLFRLRQTFDNELISGWHVGLEATSVSGIIALTAVVATWVSNRTQAPSGYYDYVGINTSEHFWGGISVAIFFAILFGLHSALLVITVIEKWTKPASLHQALSTGAQPQSTPQIIVQIMPTCPTCHGPNDNLHRAIIGDSQPQGVAPAYVVQQKTPAYSEESLE